MCTVFVGGSLPRSRFEGTRGGVNTSPLKTTAWEATANEDRRHLDRLQAVPFWIVERSREIAERQKKLEPTSGRGLGERRKKGEGKERDCALSCNRRVQGNSAYNSLTPLKIQLKMTANR